MNVLYYVRSFMKEIMLRDIWNESAEWLRYCWKLVNWTQHWKATEEFSETELTLFFD